jgi:hypothetical protein
LTKDVRTQHKLTLIEKSHRQGRFGARVSQKAHTYQLLLTLAEVCRRLRRYQSDPKARRAYQEVEQQLVEWLKRVRPQSTIRRKRKIL